MVIARTVIVVLLVLGCLGTVGATDSEPLLRLDVIEALFQKVVEADLVYVRKPFCDEIVTFGDDVLPLMIKELDSEETNRRKGALAVIARMGSDAAPAVPKAAELLDDEDLRKEALYALCRIGPSAVEAIDEILEVFSSQHPWGSMGHVMDVGKIGPGILPAMEDALEHDEWGVRLCAVYALSRLEPSAEPAVPLLAKAVEDEHWRVREIALMYLGRIGPLAREAVPMIIGAIDDPKEVVRDAALKAVWQLSPLSAPAADKLLDMLANDLDPLNDYSDWLMASAALARMGEAGAAAVPLLVDSLGRTDECGAFAVNSLEALRDFGPYASEAFDELLPLLEHKRGDIRYYAATAFGNMGPAAEPAVDDLLPLLGDEDEDVRMYTAFALGRIGRPAERIAPALAELAKSEVPEDESLEVPAAALAALAAMGPSAVDQAPVVRRVMQERSQLQIQAAYALLRMKPDDAEAMAVLLAATRGFEVKRMGALAAMGLLKVETEWTDRAIRRNLDHKDPLVLIWAAFAWQRAHPDSTDGLEILKAGIRFKTVDMAEDRLTWWRKDHIQAHAAKAVGWLGRDAEPLLPTLLVAMRYDDQPTHYSRLYEPHPYHRGRALKMAWLRIHRALEDKSLPADMPMFNWLDDPVNGRE